MISIITAIHNQYAMNELFIHSLKRYTQTPYELIIIDNNSTDGSRELFEQNGAKIIRNSANYSYPRCQNQGIKESKGNVLAFFNNDIILPPAWDVHLLEVIGKDGYDVVSFATNEFCAEIHDTQTYGRRWKRFKYPILHIFGVSRFSLRLMFAFTYGNWEKFTQKVYEKHCLKMQRGFSGSVIAMTKQGVDKIGLWDEQIQAADFDIYARCRKRHLDVGDIKPLSIISGIYIHHYQRLTWKHVKKNRHTLQNIFVDGQNIIAFDDKWGTNFSQIIVDEIKSFQKN